MLFIIAPFSAWFKNSAVSSCLLFEGLRMIRRYRHNVDVDRHRLSHRHMHLDAWLTATFQWKATVCVVMRSVQDLSLSPLENICLLPLGPFILTSQVVTLSQIIGNDQILFQTVWGLSCWYFVFSVTGLDTALTHLFWHLQAERLHGFGLALDLLGPLWHDISRLSKFGLPYKAQEVRTV